MNGQARRVERLNMGSQEDPKFFQTSRKNSRKASKLNVGQNFGGCCNGYNNCIFEL